MFTALKTVLKLKPKKEEEKQEVRMSNRRPPEGSLQLDWVFGYNGHTARNNIRINAAGHLVYYVAGVAIIHDLEQNKQSFFTGHDDDITSLTVNQDGSLAATGQLGRDPSICVWGTQDTEAVSVLHDAHTTTVAALAFSHDHQMLASVGGPPQRQELVVWDWRKGRRVAGAVAYHGKVEEVEWGWGSTTRLVTCGDKHIKFWTLQGNVLRGRAGVWGDLGHQQDQLSVSCLPDGRTVSGSEGGSINVWCADGKLQSTVVDVHPGGVLVTELHGDWLLTGGRDGAISILEVEHFALVASVPGTPSLVYEKAGHVHSIAAANDMIVAGTVQDEVWVIKLKGSEHQGAKCVVQGHGIGEVWGLATHPSRSVAVTASDDCTIRLWDLYRRLPMATTLLADGVRSVSFSPDGLSVAAGLKNGAFVVLTTENLEEQLRIQHRNEILQDIRYSPSGLLLAVASNDNFVDIYSVEKEYERLCVLEGASSFITHLDWDSTSTYLQLNSGAGERLIFKIVGLWHRYADLSDINATDANFYYGVIVTGDDFGLVKLFRFPCPKRGAKSRSFVGHSEHVTNVRWTSDSEYVVSVGGADHALFLWRYRPSNYMRQPVDIVSLNPLRQEVDSDEELLDTEDEYEGLPELTLDLEGEMASSGLKPPPLRARSAAYSSRSDRRLPAVDVPATSAFRSRVAATDPDTPPPDAPPEHYLKMKHVFGYRAHGCRDNAHWLADGCLVYPVAGVGVVLDEQTRKQRHYLHHTDDILCLVVHPDGEIVASGQMGKHAAVHVWSSSSLRILSFLEGGHSRGVSCLAFSRDGDRLASIGLDEQNSMVIWNWQKGVKLATTRAHSDKVFGVRFSASNSHKLLTYGVKQAKTWTQVGGGLTWRQVKLGIKLRQEACLASAVESPETTADGHEVWLIGLSSGHIIAVKNGDINKKVKAHKKAVHTIIVPNEFIWSGGDDGFVCQHDLNLQHCIRVFPINDQFLDPDVSVTLTSSQPSVRSLSFMAGRELPLLVGTQQGELLLMSVGEGLNANLKFKIIVQGHSKGEVWGLATHPSIGEGVTVSDDRTLRRWDLENSMALGSAAIRKPARSVHFHPTAGFIAVGFIDGSIALYTYPSLERVGSAHHRQESISDVKFSPDGRLLAVASHDSVVDLYVVDTDGDIVSKEAAGLRRVAVCRGATSFVTHVSWHSDSHLLQINTGDGEDLFYEAPSGRQQLIPDAAARELAWHSPLTCPLDASLEGIWDRNMDLTDINAVATANTLPLVATASENCGLLRLFVYPSWGSLKKHRHYAGHCSHVTNVRWTATDELLVSTGGADTAVIVWKVVAPSSEDEDDFDAHVTTAPHSSPQQFAPPPTVPLDISSEAISMGDLEVKGLDETMVLTPGILKQHTSKLPRNSSLDSMSERRSWRRLNSGKESDEADVKMLSNAALLNDDTILFLETNKVFKMDIANGPLPPEVLHSQHTTVVTALARSYGQPQMVATACQEGSIVDDPSAPGMLEDEGAMVNVWRASDGSLVTVLQGDSKDQVITSISFSPKGRQLAFLADSASIYLFNWVKGVELAQKQLREESVLLSLVHISDTTIAVLTPKSLLLCDLVGSALFVTPARASSAFMPSRRVVFTSLTSQPNRGLMYVGCSDGSVVVWHGRAAIRRVVPPAQGAHPPPKDATDVLVHTVAGNGVVFAVYRLGSVVRVQTYSTDEEHLKFYSEVSVKVPDEDWRPLSVRLGKTKLIMSARQHQPVIILNLTTSKFTLYKPYG
ncbi:WD40 repeat [Trinorchestia longiramus]|nr:WD40 repeat [Trinorchestia longiramus]